jgi:hypothetical protein
MIYLPEPENYTEQNPVIGPAIAFPGSDSAVREALIYAVNTVFQATLQGEEEIEEENEEDEDVDD